MKMRTIRALRFLAVVCAFSIAGITGSSGGQAAQNGVVVSPENNGDAVQHGTVIATGLENPRGISFGPDGRLYVAEGGLGGTHSTVGKCKQVPAPVGPYTGGFTARISAVDVTTGELTTIADKLPSDQSTLGGFVSGVADVTFLHGTLYALIGAAGCSHGLIGTYNSIDRIDASGAATPIVNLSHFQKTHPVAHPNPGDFEPDGTWFSFVAVRDALYAVEPNHGEVDVVRPNGDISRLVDVSATQGHIVPTAITSFNNQFILGNLNTATPGAQRHAKIFLLARWGQLFEIASKVTAVTGVAVHHGRIYALECYTGFYAPTPQDATSGTVVRLEPDGKWRKIVGGLSFPTAMTFGEGNTLYISNKGFGQPTNTSGEIVKVTVPDRD